MANLSKERHGQTQESTKQVRDEDREPAFPEGIEAEDEPQQAQTRPSGQENAKRVEDIRNGVPGKEDPDDADEIGKMRQRFRVEDYFIRNLIYDFYTGEVHAYLFMGASGDAKKKADELSGGSPEERKMAEWIRGGFADKPIPLGDGKPLLYEEAMQKFSQKYGIHLNTENVVSAVREIAHDKEHRKDAYREYFKCIFASAYCRLDAEKQAQIDTLCKDFNKVMMTVLQEKTGDGVVPAMKGKEFAYGGMPQEEIKEYLLSFREAANDLTRQAQIGQKRNRNAFEKTEEKVTELLNSCEKGDENALSLGVAELQALEMTHASRPKHFWLTSPIENYREKQTIKRIRGMLVDFSSDAKKVTEMEHRKSIYFPSFAKEQAKIDRFAKTAVREYDLDTVLTSENLDLDTDFIKDLPDRMPLVEPVFENDPILDDVPEIAPQIKGAETQELTDNAPVITRNTDPNNH